jgi:hypothetical protein
MNTLDDPIRSTVASRIRDRAPDGQVLPMTVLDILDERERTQRTLSADRKISDEYRKQQLRELEADVEQRRLTAEEDELSAARNPAEQEVGRILADIKGTNRPADSDTAEQRIDRHLAATHQQNALLIVAASGDPGSLTDYFDESLVTGNPDRIRQVGAIVLGRLKALEQLNTIGAREAYEHVFGSFLNWSKDHPSRMQQLRAAQARLASIDVPIRARYVEARRTFKLGSHQHGMRL